MRWFLLVAAILIAFAITAAAAPFPTMVGTVWKYEQPKFSDSIVADTGIAGMRFVKVVRSGSLSGHYYIRAAGDSVFLFDPYRRNGRPERLLYDFSRKQASSSRDTILPIDQLTSERPQGVPGQVVRVSGETITFMCSGGTGVVWVRGFGWKNQEFYCVTASGTGGCPSYRYMLKACILGRDTLYTAPPYMHVANRPLAKVREKSGQGIHYAVAFPKPGRSGTSDIGQVFSLSGKRALVTKPFRLEGPYVVRRASRGAAKADGVE